MEEIAISFGGSVFYPKRFRKRFIENFLINLPKNKKYHIICGGGFLARKYISNCSKNKFEKDLEGIKATKENKDKIQEIVKKLNLKNIKLYSGTVPGRSTDFVAVEIAIKNKINTVINVSNINYLYNKDPKLKSAKILKSTSWKEFFKIIGNKREAGGHYPFDFIASKLAQKNKIEVIIVNGEKFNQVKKAILKEKFIGSTIHC